MAAKVSVIMPVYNAAEYLKTSVGSLLAQTYPHLEILCVDDGSTDDSLAILQEYASKDERIKIVQSDHAGAGIARNVALDAASGDYVAFLDATILAASDRQVSRCHTIKLAMLPAILPAV